MSGRYLVSVLAQLPKAGDAKKDSAVANCGARTVRQRCAQMTERHSLINPGNEVVLF